MQPPHLPNWARVVSDFVLFSKLIHPYPAFYAISVRRFGILPAKFFTWHPASFRFHLTMDTLAFGYHFLLPSVQWTFTT